MKKTKKAFVLVFNALLAAFVISGCDINNPIIDDWWVGETPEPVVAKVPVTAFTFRFDVQGGNYIDLINDPGDDKKTDAPPDQRVEAGQTSVYEPGLVVNTTTPYLSGWYTAPASAGEKWNFDKTLVSAVYDTDADGIITLYAGWSDTGYTVTFDPNGDFNGNSSIDTDEIDFTKTSYKPENEKIASGAEMAQPKGFGLKPTDPLASTYVFIGWYTDKKCTAKWDFTKPVTADMTLYAGWGKKVDGAGTGGGVITRPETEVDPGDITPIYTVKFENNGAKSSVPNELVLDGEKIPAPNAIQKDGFTFVGWYKESSLANKWDFSTEIVDETDDTFGGGDDDNSFTLYAKWETYTKPTPTPIDVFNVRFDIQGGDYIDLVNDPDNTKTGDAPPNQLVKNGETSVHDPGLVVKTGKYLSGWYIDNNGNGNVDIGETKWDFDTTIVPGNAPYDSAGNITLYAGWSDTGAIVTFNVNGDFNGNGSIDADEIDFTKTTYTPKPEYIASGAEIAQPKDFGLKSNDPLVSTYVFIGWYTDKECTTKWDFTKPVTADMTLYAGWGKKVDGKEEQVTPPDDGPEIDVYTVKFADDDAKSSVPNELVLDGEKLPAPNAIQKDGFTFVGWYKESSLANKWDFSTDIVEESCDTFGGGADDNSFTLYAKWETYTKPDPPPPIDIDVFNVRFDMQGGDYIDLINDPSNTKTGDAPPNQRVKKDEVSVHEPGLVVKTGKYLSGWYTEPDSGGSKWDFDTTIVPGSAPYDSAGNITLYAGWSDTGAIVTFNPGGDFDGNGRYDSINEIGWPDTSYEPKPEYIAPGVVLSQPKGFGLKSGSAKDQAYAFTGWYIDNNHNGIVDIGDTKWDFTKPVTADMTLYAGWGTKIGEGVVPPEKGGAPAVVYTVQFETNGAVTSAPDEVVLSGHSLPSPAAIYKEGYVFCAWYKNSSFTAKWDFGTDIVEESCDTFDGGADDNSFTLYAKWEPEPYTDPWFEEHYEPVPPEASDKPYYPFQCDPGYYDFGDYDHVGGDADYNTNFDNQMTVIELLKDNPTWVARIVGYADVGTASGDPAAKLIADRETTSWWLLWTETGVGDNQLIVHSKLPAGYDENNLSGAMIIGPNAPRGAVGPDGDEIKVYIYKPLN